METMLSGFNQYDNDQKARLTRTGMTAALREGRWTFPAPFGYRFTRKSERDRSMLVQDERMAGLIKWALETFSTRRHSQREVLRMATERGLRKSNGKKITPQYFRRMLTHPIYAGILQSALLDAPVKGAFEPLISPETFALNQEILSGRRPTFAPHLRNNPEFPLRGFTRCELCGKSFTGAFSTGRKGKKYPLYRCTGSGCPTRSIRKDVLETDFVNLLTRLRPDAGKMRMFKLILDQVWRTKEADAIDERKRREVEVARLRSNDERLLHARLYDAHPIDQETYEREHERLRNEIMLAELAASEARTEQIEIESLLEYAEQVLPNAERLWVQLNLDQKQRFQKVLFPAGVTYSRDKGIGTAETCLFFEALPASGAETKEMAPREGFEPPT